MEDQTEPTTRPLTRRQRAFLAAYLGPSRPCRFNATKSALAAGYSPKHPRQSGHQVTKAPAVVATLRQWREEQDRAWRAEMAARRRRWSGGT